MKVTDFKKHFLDTLANEFPKEETGSFFNILSQEYLGLSRLDLALDQQRELSPAEFQKLEQALEKLKQHEPIQYITGHTEFFGLEFRVNKSVLIPRPETEELVEWILSDLDNSGDLKIIDIGTGSGCIAISLAKNLREAKISAIDISAGALKVAKENAELNKVSVDFLRKDILNTNELPERYDIIVSNPPYVRELEREEMQRNVLEHEPYTALYVKDEDPLLFYRKISQLSSDYLNEGGKIYLEINQYLGKETEDLFEEKNFQTRLKKDIFGVDRMLRAIKI